MNAVCLKKSELLRTVEQLCYQVAHYLLGNENDAAVASKEALVELYAMPIFESGTDADRKQLAQAAATRHALQRARLTAMRSATQKAATASLYQA
ncbi:hypothetical protein [Paenibacillus sp. GCM10027626]|uniref:hypothetical protein n=1 Tax=Paenibacillus sp. GCM10027626 TaxID=3273411 RepID=UPI00363DE6C1